ncbi:MULTISPECIES: alpha/beta hydrolase-fold protein [Arthrobacter]|uniref:Alpha/beta hydrolase-fold protein n=2 Tax=Arthrobacter TaxID=1663 RepID=A0ABU9KL77_9MICC|nr:alpha/beta hydrolase-fold protein [Arthrobacter sp. YJM1]MDP5227664.1 alpha/beta hydrolase-fold protein [Arthrobacter sp. YJM1]
MDSWKPILDIAITGPRFLLAWTILSALLVVYLFLKRRRGRWFLVALGSLVVGTLVGLAVCWYIQDVDNTFGEPLLFEDWFWAPAAVAGIALAVVNLRGGRWWRTVLSALSVIVFLATATFQINAAYGLNPTIGALLDINTASTVRVPSKGTWRALDADEPLYKSWQAPDGMPDVGLRGRTPAPIPATHSGFNARWAGLYLPPAARVKNPPLLPFVLLMMGQPGFPSPIGVGDVADAMAKKNHGLAPVILVVDQLGDPSHDPLCLDGPLGNVETYVMKDVLPWARASLPILQDRKHWSFLGYSNGGVCASYFASKYPQDFGSFISVSGEEFQGSEKPAQVLAQFFKGNQAAYNAVMPRNIMRKHGKYADMIAVYTAGTKDPKYTAAAKESAATARQVGMKTYFLPVPGAGHVGPAYGGGIQEAFTVLFPYWGLAPPA